jgi:hypothetical protein
VGEGQEDGVGLRDLLADRQPGGGQVGVDGLDGFGAPTSPGETDQLHGWMPSQDADQLGSGVASGAYDRNADSFVRRALPATRPD